MNLADLLKSAGVKDEVIAGLPPEVSTAVSSHLTDADKKFTDAAELRRQAELERAEVIEYVEKYGTSLTEMAGVKAQNEAYRATLVSLNKQGFDIPISAASSEPVVPGSPARGANASGFDPEKFRAEVNGSMGTLTATFIDASNRHMALYGVPLPDSAFTLAQEAQRAHKPLDQYIGEKYRFAEKESDRRKADEDKRVNDAAEKKFQEKLRQHAEANGNNPYLRPGVASNNSAVPKIKSEEFHKADGNVPARERRNRLLGSIHRDIEASRVSG